MIIVFTPKRVANTSVPQEIWILSVPEIKELKDNSVNSFAILWSL